LTVDQLMAKHSGYTRGIVPPDADTLTAFIDIQGKCLYWLVVAWRSEDFTGWIVDYGAWPDQGVTYFTLAQVRQTLAKKYPGAGVEGRTKAGLIDCISFLANKVFTTPNGNEHRIRRIGIDAAWGTTTKIVQEVARTHDHAAQLMPCFGRGIRPAQAPLESWRPVEGERRGLKLLVRPTKGGGRHMLIDSNYYKTFVHNRFATADGDRGSLCFPKAIARYKTEHKMPAEHCRAENRKHEITEERRGDVWSLPPHKPDNHFFDCIVNCTALASLEGVKLAEHRPSKVTKKKKKRGYSGSLAA
jgi:phage terminase large subunit GpA-like protein